MRRVRPASGSSPDRRWRVISFMSRRPIAKPIGHADDDVGRELAEEHRRDLPACEAEHAERREVARARRQRDARLIVDYTESDGCPHRGEDRHRGPHVLGLLVELVHDLLAASDGQRRAGSRRAARGSASSESGSTRSRTDVTLSCSSSNAAHRRGARRGSSESEDVVEQRARRRRARCAGRPRAARDRSTRRPSRPRSSASFRLTAMPSIGGSNGRIGHCGTERSDGPSSCPTRTTSR